MDSRPCLLFSARYGVPKQADTKRLHAHEF